jgi:hypothetical protein
MKIELIIKCHMCQVNKSVLVEQSDYDRWRSKQVHIQDALPYLRADERELLMSKTCGPCFDKLFRDED